MSPADVVRVVVDEEDRSMEVVVADDQLSLAIGRKGQNVKLASKLTGWRIDVRSESVAEEESKRARKALESIPGIGFGESELLYQEGYRSVREVAAASAEDIAAIDGLDAEKAASILAGAISIAKDLVDGESSEEQDEQSSKVTDIDQLILPLDLKGVLIENGFDSIQALAELNAEQLTEATGLRPEESELVCSATEAFLRVQRPEAV